MKVIIVGDGDIYHGDQLIGNTKDCEIIFNQPVSMSIDKETEIIELKRAVELLEDKEYTPKRDKKGKKMKPWQNKNFYGGK